MRRLNLEKEYNNRERVREYPQIAQRWQAASQAFRDSQTDHGAFDIAYGERERQRYDLFAPQGASEQAPLVVYIHGGYWQRGDRKDFSCVAEAFVASGCRVALPSYSLCPDVSVMDIIAEMASFLSALYQKTGVRPVVVGHSAGGHLAAAMLATDWSQHNGAPSDLVTKAVAISGVFTLRPLTRTSLNDALNLTSEAADAASPVLWQAPPAGRTLVAAVGARESREFIRQSLEIAGRWGEADVTTDCVVVPDANHFTVVDHLMKPGSGLNRRVIGMAKAE